jgi:LysR family transcriptional regulator, regulator for metE and metH
MFLEVRHLRLIDAISRQGSVTRAGSVLHLSQSALSHQLKELEEQLGLPLFHRVRKRMVPTQAGERLLAGAHSILEQLGALEGELAELNEDRAGVLRISTECYTAYHWLPGRVAAFARKFPRIQVKVVIEATGHPIEALVGGHLDLAIVSCTPQRQEVEYRPLFQDDMLVVLRRDHPAASRPHFPAEAFADETLIVYNSPYEGTFTFEHVLRPAGVRPRRILEVQLTEGILEFVRAGMGIAVLARWAVAPYLESGELVGLQLTERPLRRQWSAATLRCETPPPHLSEFVNLLSEQPRTGPISLDAEMPA